jgi:hypothetical protein
MYVATLDILTEKGGFNPQAARAIGEAIDLEIARSRDTSVTREDLSECRRALSEEIGARGVETDKNVSALHSDLSAVRAELKEDISGLRAELKEDISGLRAELKEDISGLRTELKEDISGLRTELKEDINGLRTELQHEIGGLRTELTAVRGDLREGMSALRAELRVDGQTIKADLVRWVFVVITGQSAMLLGILYFFLKYFK